MKQLTATVPGKAVISGEYAVLVGAPAIAVALDRRAVVKVESVVGDYHVISTPGFATGSWRFSTNEVGEIRWHDELPEGGLTLVEAAFAAADFDDRESKFFSIDTRAFADDSTCYKLGLGSSAAAISALVAVLCELGEQEFALGETALAAHANFQSGLGSGVDIATSLAGGVIEYRMGDAANMVRHAWPDDLFYAILWSGRPASTQARVSKFDQSNSNHSSVSALVAAASDVANVWACQQSTNILASLGAYTESLLQFNLVHGLGIFDAGHEGLYATSISTDVLYKPCGAGGGDIGIALSLDAFALLDYVAEAEKLGFRELSVAMDSNGVVVSKVD
jgi:phosphomevalonate kinase